MRAGFTMRLRDNVAVPTEDVWSMLTACRDDDLDRVDAHLADCPSLLLCDYNYMAPLHLAVREGRLEIVRLLASRGAVNPNYRTYPYRETLVTMAVDRGYTEIASVLEEHARSADPNRPEDEGGHIEYVTDFERRRFERMVTARDYKTVREMLDQRPELALDPFAFWAEGVLSIPANQGDHKMLALLMEYGAAVPEITKWGREYYFKRDDTAAFLIERGMSPRHMNCHRTTLLHGMAQIGELRRARLLLDHGAEIDAVDDEFRSTPLGLAARWGREKMVRLLLDRGADRERAGAEWATPREWARRKGHEKIVRLLG
jgi:ankyrin repeat protein